MNIIEQDIPAAFFTRLTPLTRIVVFTGAGISLAAGIPTISGPGSQPIWQYNLIEELLSAEKHQHRKLQLNRWLDQMLIISRVAIPTTAHKTIQQLSDRFKDLTVITQNFDGLHQQSDSYQLIELHGNIAQARCSSCNNRIKIEQSYQQLCQHRCNCGGEWRADLLFFDEQLAPELWCAAETVVRNCQIMIVIGSSGQVLPGGLLPAIARRSGAIVLEINLIPTEISAHCEFTILGDCQQIVPQLLERREE